MDEIKTLISNFEKKFPGRKVEKVCDYKGQYLIGAPDGDESNSNSIFICSKQNTNTFKAFVPTEDLEGFTDAVYKHELYPGKQ